MPIANWSSTQHRKTSEKVDQVNPPQVSENAPQKLSKIFENLMLLFVPCFAYISRQYDRGTNDPVSRKTI